MAESSRKMTEEATSPKKSKSLEVRLHMEVRCAAPLTCLVPRLFPRLGVDKKNSAPEAHACSVLKLGTRDGRDGREAMTELEHYRRQEELVYHTINAKFDKANYPHS